MKFLTLTVIFFLFNGITLADEFLTTRLELNFPEAMMKLQTILKEEGYTLSRVQKVDEGLKKNGYDSDKYRVVFYGRGDEGKFLSKNHPELIPYLPLKIAIFAENEHTLLIATNPEVIVNNPPEILKIKLQSWKSDLQRIFMRLNHDAQ